MSLLDLQIACYIYIHSNRTAYWSNLKCLSIMLKAIDVVKANANATLASIIANVVELRHIGGR
jgi:hypothetical protein